MEFGEMEEKYDGQWNDGTWNRGKWIGGEILNQETRKFEKSKKAPSI